MNHAELVARAEQWLRNTRRCRVVFVELASYSNETPDAIGWTTWDSILVECKVSYADFMAERNKPYRWRQAQKGLGTERWYLTLPSIIPVEELPTGWGLAECNGKVVRIIRDARPQEVDRQAEIRMLVSQLGLIQSLARGQKPLFPSGRITRIVNDARIIIETVDTGSPALGG